MSPVNALILWSATNKLQSVVPSTKGGGLGRVLIWALLAAVGSTGIESFAQTNLMPNQCFNEPKKTEDLPGNIFWVQFCQPQGKACFPPPAPELDTDTISDNVQASTILIKATKPANYDVDVAVWQVWRQKPGVLQLAYEYRQRAGVPSGIAEGTVRFAATGLVQPVNESGWSFFFTVAYCSESSPGTIDKCGCFSPASNVVATSSFDGADPDGTGPLQINFEDQFRRANTTKTISGGDGLGPSSVWLELATGSGGRPTIIDTERVLAPQPANMLFVARQAASPNVYTELLYRRDTDETTDLYNVDATGRGHIPTGSPLPSAYAVKLVNEPTDLTLSADKSKPELQVRRFSGNTATGSLKSWQVRDLDGTATGCDGTIPLADSTTALVLLVLESDDGGANGDPRLRATVGWGGCTEDGGLASCTNQCQSSWWTEEDDPGIFKTKTGWWGFFVHHHTYRIDAFRAGGAPPQ